ncbi:MAG: hypothetical protein KKH91_03205 [Elusimicrobia bacterium]|nr:hypothetical protein [Elusimicrobiota bacterium]
MPPEIESILNNHNIEKASSVTAKISALAEKFAQVEISVSKSISGLLSAILKDTKRIQS